MEPEDNVLYITNSSRRHSCAPDFEMSTPKAPKESRIPWTTATRPISPPPTPTPDLGEFLPFIPLPALPYFLPPRTPSPPTRNGTRLPKPVPRFRREKCKKLEKLETVVELIPLPELDQHDTSDDGHLTPDDVASALLLFPIPPDRMSMDEARDDAESITVGRGLGLGDPIKLVWGSKSRKRRSRTFTEEDEAAESRDTFALHSRRESDASLLLPSFLYSPSRHQSSSVPALPKVGRVDSDLFAPSAADDSSHDDEFWSRLRAVEVKKKRRESWAAGSRMAVSAEVKRSRRRSMDALVVALGM